MRRRAAFTLVELLIGMALTILMGGTLYLFQSQGLSTVTKGTIRLNLQSEIRRKLEKLVIDLRACNEVLEIQPDMIKFTRFRSSTEESDAGEINLDTITYTLAKVSNRWSLLRAENNQQPLELISHDHIEGNLFFPLYEDTGDPGADTPPQLLPFDMNANDSGQRKRITFIRLRIRVRQAREFVGFTTAVTLRAPYQRLQQPHWKFR
ncbi:MAG TPA: prepilin-type N-terminal cleavage/methylation domain-containing protein [Candidatus Ozemobacteraceae bacterium]|nr:prepilin-type N-terminal cleavage/methylation domain-containing protein [Candidatus Ozemobacteraceae bacterium]